MTGPTRRSTKGGWTEEDVRPRNSCLFAAIEMAESMLGRFACVDCYELTCEKMCIN